MRAFFNTPLSVLFPLILSVNVATAQSPHPTPAPQSRKMSCGAPAATIDQIRYILNEVASKAIERNGSAICIPLKAHIVRKDDHSGGIGLYELNYSLSYLNYSFRSTGIQFFWQNMPNYIDNTDLYDFDQRPTDLNGADTEEMLASHTTESITAINIYFLANLTSEDGTSLNGYAYYPAADASSNRIFIKTGNMLVSPGGVLAHEMGHYFGLLHTHEGTEKGNTYWNAENVDRLGAWANCETTGDLISDTEADPGYNPMAFNSALCEYTGNQTDRYNVAYQPPVGNIMSYYPDACGGFFTDGQQFRIRQGLSTRQEHINYSDGSAQDIVTPPTELKATLNLSVNSVVLSWNDMANNEMGYIVERAENAAGPFISLPGGVTLPNDSQFQDSKVEANAIYYYRIKATNGGCDNYSNVVSIQTGIMYCHPQIQGSGTNSFMSHFDLKAGNKFLINLNTGQSPTAYSDFTNNEAAPLTAGSTYGFNVKLNSNNTGFAAQNIAIWIDLNHDGDFEDSNERMFRSTGAPTSANISNTFSLPTNIMPGITRLRIRSCPAPLTVDSPCETYASGETEDYSVNISLPGGITQTMEYFQGEQQGNQIQLSWKLTSDNGTPLLLEHSRDGVNFESVATNDDFYRNGEQFSWRDEQPNQGDNFYRLQVAATNDAPQPLAMTTVHFTTTTEEDQNSLLFPNPAYYDINVRWFAQYEGKTSIELYNNSGIQLQEINTISKTGTNQQTLDIQTLKPGSYFIRIRQLMGQQTLHFTKVN